MIAFLASDRASFVTGAEICVDGGSRPSDRTGPAGAGRHSGSEDGMERTGTGQAMHLGVWYDFRNPAAWRISWQQLYNETLDQASGPKSSASTVSGCLSTISPTMAICPRSRRTGGHCRADPAGADRHRGPAGPAAPSAAAAEDLAVVDLISNGRLDIGLAAGYRSKEFEVMAVPRTERGQRTGETVQLLRQAWSGERFSFHGKSYHYQDVTVTPPPAQQAAAALPGRQHRACGPASGPAGLRVRGRLRRAARSVRVYAEAFTMVDGGLPAPEIKANRMIYVTEDPERAWQLLGTAPAAPAQRVCPVGP